jgi:hypothetical protein
VVAAREFGADDAELATRQLLLGRNYALFPTRQFRCYFCKIPLLFHCYSIVPKNSGSAASH